VGGLAGILPSGIFEGLSRMAGRLMKGGPDGSQAALYGIHASFNNRGDVKKLVENLLDGIYS
jgi:hypothetical protein